ncbi:MAG: DNA repair exonuclease [Candidatus Pacearchaeota archaeon]|nr:MAG: DNA repair exonuclease [Candidatus Pacearchaeota archaeon]
MKFAHIADCHLGSWRQPNMRALNIEAFEKAINKCISECVDFLLIVGDLFDTAVPSIEILKTVAEKLRKIKEKGIICYVVPGSHDYSVSGKNMISVLDKAGLCVDLSQREEIIQGNVLLYGIAGKKGGFEQKEINEHRDYFKKLNEKISLLKKEKNIYSILLLHTSVFELLSQSLTDKIDALSIKDLPLGFDYYALGHIHSPKIYNQEKIAVYPGSLFPCNFNELERQHTSNFLIIEKKNGEKESIKKVSINLKKVINLDINANKENPQSLKEKILSEFKKNNLKDAIITLRISGILEEGKPSELDFMSLEEKAGEIGAYILLRNTSKLSSKEFEIKIQAIETKNIEEIEKASLITAIKENIITEKDKDKFPSFFRIFNIEKLEGETTSIFTSRLTKEAVKALKLEELWK